MKKRILAAVLAMLFCFAGCSGEEAPSDSSWSGTNDANWVAGTKAYKITEKELPTGVSLGDRYEIAAHYGTQFMTYDGKVGILMDKITQEQYDEKASEGSLILLGNYQFTLFNMRNKSYSSYALTQYDEKTETWSAWSGSAPVSITAMPDDGFATLMYDYAIVRWDEDGQELWRLTLEEYQDVLIEDPSRSTTLMSSIEGNLYLYTADSMTVFSQEGEHLYTAEIPASVKPLITWGTGSSNERIKYLGDFPNLVRDADGNVMFCYLEKSMDGGRGSYVCLPVDDAAKGFGERKELPDTAGSAPIFAPGYDVYYKTDLGLFGVNMGEMPVKLFSWVDIGLRLSMLSEVYVFSEDEMLVYQLENRHLNYVLIEADGLVKEDERQVIRIACDNTGSSNTTYKDIAAYAGTFNRYNDDYRVELIPYANETDGKTATEKLVNDMLTGNIPDIVVFNSRITPESLEKWDMFTDLYEFMDGDKRYKRDAFLNCVLTPFENDRGELPYLTTEYYVSTLVGKKSIFGDRSGWTFEEMLEMSGQMKEGQSIFALPTAQSENLPLETLSFLLPYLLEKYVDYENQTVSFDGSFRQLLEFCKNAPIYYSSGYGDPNKFQSDEVLLKPTSYSLTPYLADRYSYFPDGGITYIGYPQAESGVSGTVINPMIRLGITRQSKLKEGAWEFIKACLDEQAGQWDSYTKWSSYDTMTSQYFPATHEALDSLIEAASYFEFNITVRLTTNPTTKAESYGIGTSTNLPRENLSEVERQAIEETNRKNGTKVIRMTEDDAADLRELLDSINATYIRDNDTVSIILEDASAYFAGVKTLDEVVKLIENRVSTRISE
ncbi:MAG: hypothetical protein IJ493_10850 [Clostridia bacterium]|nr:hypothetical protein [Clostridia bacterium]